MSELADAAKIGKPTATVTVNSLIKMGLVNRERVPNDRRQVMVNLTTKGKALLARFLGRIEQEA